MAGGNNVKKGFGTYLFIFFLILVLAFLVVVGIMVLKPSTPVLGMKYFYYNKDQKITSTISDDEIDFSSLEEINFNTGYSNVSIERSVAVDHPTIAVKNFTMGFAKANQAIDFTYKASFVEDNSHKLNIEVVEPTGFLFLNKNITISYLVPSNATLSLENVKINIISDSGNGSIGNIGELSSGESALNFGNISFKTNSGNLVINKCAGEEIKQIFFNSNNGRFINNKENLKISEKFDLHSASGNLYLNNLTYLGPDSINLDLQNSKLSAMKITGNVVLDINAGYVDVIELLGNLSSSETLSQFGSATIDISMINGNIILPNANAAKLNFGRIDGDHQVYIDGTSSNVTIGDTECPCWITTTTGNVYVVTSADDIWIKTVSGNISVMYENDEIYDSLDLISQKGRVDFAVKSNLKFVLKAYNSKGNLRSSSNIHVELYDNRFTNPLVVNNGTKVVSITTDSVININLI